MTDRYPILPGAEPWSSPGKGERAGIAILVSHGFTGNPTSVRRFGETLAERGFAIEVVRWPGHGTHWRDMAKTRYSDWRREVERALDELASAGKRVVLAGLSLGGTICLDLGCTRPEAVAGVVAINAAILDREGFVAKAAPVLEKILPVVPASAAGLAKNDCAKGCDEHAYAWVPARAGNSVLKEFGRIRAGVARMTVPALIAYSPNDHSAPPDNSRTILKLLEGKDARELVLPNSYHLATLDYDFDLLVDEVERFADRVAAAR